LTPITDLWGSPFPESRLARGARSRLGFKWLIVGLLLEISGHKPSLPTLERLGPGLALND